MATNVQNERKRLHVEATRVLQELVTHYAEVEGLPVVGIHVRLAEAIRYGDACDPPVIMAVNAEIRFS